MSSACIREWLTVLSLLQFEVQNSHLSFLDMNRRFCQGLSCATHFSWTLERNTGIHLFCSLQATTYVLFN